MNLFDLTKSFFLISAMLGSLKLAVHLPIMNFVFPSNVMIYLENIVPVVMYDVLNEFTFDDDFFYYSLQGKKVYDIRTQVKDLSYSNHNIFMTLGTLAFVYVLYFVQLVFFFFLVSPMKS